MGALSSDRRDAKNPQKERAAHAVIPFHSPASVPDWLSAMPQPAVIVRLADDELAVEKCNALYAERFLADMQQFLAVKGKREAPRYRPAEDIGQSLYEFMVAFIQSDRQRADYEVVAEQALGEAYLGCVLGRLSDGADGARRMLVTIIDRTSERQTERNLRRELVSDSLTGLPNRTGFIEQADARLADSGLAPVEQYAVLAIDLVRFSRINESLGSVAGDELIITVARRLKSSLRQGDILGRLGGNEFGIFARLSNGLSDALQIVQRVNGALAAPCRLSDLQLSIDCAIGCALSGNEEEQMEDILRQAQAAMKLAKKSGKLEIYRPGVLREARQRFDMESRLREALANGRLELDYQPIINLQNGAITGFEALARWRDAEQGDISPTDFIPVAEESGLITPLGRWVAYEAAQTLAKWDRAHGSSLPIGISVNLSPIQMSRDDVPNVVEEALRYSGISGRRLTIELTESAIIADPDKARHVLIALKGLEVAIAMDDFGTGFSNLASLQSLPIDILKIDRDFVTPMLEDRDKHAIVRAIVSLANALNLKTTAEGIESARLGEVLAGYGCMLGQGFHFARPMPAQEAFAFWQKSAG